MFKQRASGIDLPQCTLVPKSVSNRRDMRRAEPRQLKVGACAPDYDTGTEMPFSRASVRMRACSFSKARTSICRMRSRDTS